MDWPASSACRTPASPDARPSRSPVPATSRPIARASRAGARERLGERREDDQATRRVGRRSGPAGHGGHGRAGRSAPGPRPGIAPSFGSTTQRTTARRVAPCGTMRSRDTRSNAPAAMAGPSSRSWSSPSDAGIVLRPGPRGRSAPGRGAPAAPAPVAPIGHTPSWKTPPARTTKRSSRSGPERKVSSASPCARLDCASSQAHGGETEEAVTGGRRPDGPGAPRTPRGPS